MVDDSSIVFFMGKFIVGMLIFVRVTGMMASAPVFRSPAVPVLTKVMFAVILSIIINTALWKEHPTIEFHPWLLVLLVFKEFFVGLVIGFAANGVFYAANMAGGIVDMDMGFQTATLFDRDNMTPTLIGQLKEFAALMVFFIIDGHHYLIEGMFLSVKAIPLTTMEITSSTLTLLIKMATTVLILAVKMAAPVLIALFLTNLSLALLARVAPQTNIFILSFQMKVAVGLLVLLGSIPLFVLVAKWAMGSFQNDLYTVIMSLYPGRV